MNRSQLNGSPRPNISVKLGKIFMKNPVMTASGTFGFGREYGAVFDLTCLGAIAVKSITLKPRSGHPAPRLAETPAGVLNCIGLQNPGIEAFLADELPFLQGLGIPVIVSIAGDVVEEYADLSRKLTEVSGISGLEVNISCPNVARGGAAFGSDPGLAREVVRAVRSNTDLTVIAKLSPNVTDIAGIARAVVDAGADAVSLINTLKGMAIDVDRRRPILSNVFGGLSGPAVKPVALRMIWEVARSVDVPVVGMGGIVTARDALEFIIAGATAVAVGTGNFLDPYALVHVIEGIEDYLSRSEMRDINELVGCGWKGLASC